MRWGLALLALAAAAAAASLAFPRLAPLVLRVAAVAAVALAALWAYEYLAYGRLASRILRLLRDRGPMDRRELLTALGARPEELDKALEALRREGQIRAVERDGTEYYDLA